MLFCALACDYDGTLACDGRVDEPTLEALRRFKATGKRLILITGRELADLRAVFDPMDDFDAVVVENGAVMYLPATQEERSLAPPPPERFITSLRAKGVKPLSVGRSIVATWTANESAVLETIRELGLDWQLTFNKGAVMCLPPGIDKASGLRAALEQLKLSAHNVVGIGDAENDQAFSRRLRLFGGRRECARERAGEGGPAHERRTRRGRRGADRSMARRSRRNIRGRRRPQARIQIGSSFSAGSQPHRLTVSGSVAKLTPPASAAMR
jgi:HAD superfamily hydrolase (TIGR01484 family)